MCELTVACIGHRNIARSAALEKRTESVMRELISLRGAGVFLLGSRSDFNDLCGRALDRMKAEFPDVRKVYVRAEYAEIPESYRGHLLCFYDDTVFPECVRGAGRNAYIARNRFMVDNSGILLTYYDESLPHGATSGTATAVRYAVRRGKNVINIFV